MVLAGFALLIIVLLIIGMPVAFTLSLAGILGIIQFVDMSTLSQVPVIAFKTLNSYVLTSVPLYILMSQIMLTGRVGSGLFDLGSKWMGHLPGGLGIATIFACAIFAAISGSSVATAVTIGAMAIPEMLKRGYDRKLVVGSVAAGGTLGILIPPSIPMILYGTITDESVGKLFMSGVMPGALLTLAFVAYIVFASWNKPREARATHAEKMKALRENIWGLLLPVIIIGGIRIGIFTATEAGAVAILYAAFLGFIYHEMHIKDMIQGLKETVCTTASIMLIVSAASVFSWILTKERIPQALTAWMLANIHSKYVFLIVVNIFLLIVGMFIEGNASMIILVPLLAPIAAQYGINEIQFAMIYIFNNAIGALSPPMGTLMFVTCSITKCKTAAFIKEAVPFYILLIVNLMLLTWVEPFTTFLVNLFY